MDFQWRVIFYVCLRAWKKYSDQVIHKLILFFYARNYASLEIQHKRVYYVSAVGKKEEGNLQRAPSLWRQTNWIILPAISLPFGVKLQGGVHLCTFNARKKETLLITFYTTLKIFMVCMLYNARFTFVNIYATLEINLKRRQKCRKGYGVRLLNRYQVGEYHILVKDLEMHEYDHESLYKHFSITCKIC